MLKKYGKEYFLGAIITLGIVYGDIGTSPLYVMNALIGDQGGVSRVTPNYIIGCLSLIFWTLMIITTIKYVVIAMRADNHGEGGIFALYALVKKRAKWLIIPALIGGAAILADGTLTPAVTVTTAIEGLKGFKFGNLIPVSNQNDVVFITIAILLVLFLVQRLGTSSIGKTFGVVMVFWFGFLAVFGFANMCKDLTVLRALNPIYGLQVLFSPHNKMGIFILGSIFLATTGAEALYSDMGHVGRRNIYITWPFVYLSLILNYFGQGAWIIHQIKHQTVTSNINPFYDMLPHSVYLVGVIIATLAAIIASQALITGSYTLVEEAIGLKILPRLKVYHPNVLKGQIYIGVVNWILCVITLSVVFFFRTSEHMEAAYGLAITLTMLMTTFLLFEYIRGRWSTPLALTCLLFFGTIETIFFISSLVKFVHGGYVTALITAVLIFIMVIWYYGNRVRDDLMDATEEVCLDDYVDQLVALSQDESIPLYMSNLVMLAKVKPNHKVKREILYSILDKQPKRAKVYWFVTVNTTNEPYTNYYTVDMMGTRNVVNLQLYLGFKSNHSLNLYLRQIVNDLMDQGVIDEQPQEYTTTPGRKVGDFVFVLIRELLSPNTNLSPWKRFLISSRIWLQNHSTSPVQWFGLEFSDVKVERVPLYLKKRQMPFVNQQKIINAELPDEFEE